MPIEVPRFLPAIGAAALLGISGCGPITQESSPTAVTTPLIKPSELPSPLPTIISTIEATATIIPIPTPTSAPTSISTPTPTPEATKVPEATATPKVVERKILLSSKDGKPYPLGITEVGWSLGTHRIQVSGFISKQVYEENGDLFYGLSIPDPSNPSKEIELQVFLSRKSMLGVNKVGTAAAINRTVTISPTHRARPTSEVIPYLKEGEQAVIQVSDRYEESYLNKTLNDPTCDDACQQRIPINVAYAAETQKNLNRIKNQTNDDNPLIIGPTAEITMNFD